MRFWSKDAILAVGAVAAAAAIGFVFTGHAAAQQAPTPPKGPIAGTTFKNVTTASLKDLTVDDFLGAMGVMAAALGYDCADCHPGAGSDRVDWVIDTPKKVRARKMVDMVASINKTFFAGTQSVTCFTCHHGKDLPTTTIALDTLYGPPNDERRDLVTAAEGAPPATQILDKYIQAVGGAQRWAAIKSFIATGTSLGYEGLGGGGTFTILGQRPDKRTTKIEFKEHPERGDSTRTFDGKEGWIKSPRSLLGEFELTGTEWDGARLDAELAFPDQIKTALTNWKVGSLESMGDKDVQVLQGSGPRGVLATFYFDKDSGLLIREVRYGTSPIGHVPIQMDFSDYRDVNGVKFPFKYQFSWLDGRDQFQLNEVRTNVNIDASQFAKP